jgi:uncharacterized protein
MICSYECTYCRDCVTLFSNVCPNCGGGFEPRPIRPVHAWKPGVSLAHQPATTRVIHKPTDPARHQAMVDRVGDTPPEQR